MEPLTTTDLEAQRKRMRQESINLTYYQPFFGALYLYLKRVETHSIGTMAVDGKRLYWNPDFVATLGNAELLGVLAHETLHCALAHFARRQERSPRKWNQAADFAINLELIAAGFSLPQLIQPYGRGNPVPICLDETYEGLTAEEIYNRLPEPPPSGGGGGEPAGMGDVIDAEGAEAKETEIDWQIRTRQAATQAGKFGGKVPGSIVKMIDALNNPTIDWRERLRAFVGSALSHDVTWANPVRRHVWRGLHMPSRARDIVDEVIVLLDMSGSIYGDPELQRQFLSECQGILDEGQVSRIRWACVDTEIASEGTIEQGESFHAFEVTGGGGTSFESAMEWASEQEGACIIFLTDGMTCSWGDDPGKPVLVVGAIEHKAYLDQCPFGEVAVIKP